MFSLDEIMTQRKNISLKRDQHSALVRAKAEFEQITGEEISLAEFVKIAATNHRKFLSAINEQSKNMFLILLELQGALIDYGYDNVASDLLEECLNPAIEGDQEEFSNSVAGVIANAEDPAELLPEIVQESLGSSFEEIEFREG